MKKVIWVLALSVMVALNGCDGEGTLPDDNASSVSGIESINSANSEEAAEGVPSEDTEGITSEDVISTLVGTVIQVGGNSLHIDVEDDGLSDDTCYVFTNEASFSRKNGDRATIADIKPGMTVSCTLVNGEEYLSYPPQVIGCTEVVIETEQAETELLSDGDIVSSGEVVGAHNGALLLKVDKAEWGSEEIYLMKYNEVIENASGNKISQLDLWPGMTVEFTVTNGSKDMYKRPMVHGCSKVKVTGIPQVE